MKKMMITLALTALSANVCAQTLPKLDQLETTVRTVYPVNVTTVQQAIEYLIEPLDYYVITDYPAPSSAIHLLEQPIPESAKVHRTMPVLHAIQLLIGEDNTIILDRENELITFQRGH